MANEVQAKVEEILRKNAVIPVEKEYINRINDVQCLIIERDCVRLLGEEIYVLQGVDGVLTSELEDFYWNENIGKGIGFLDCDLFVIEEDGEWWLSDRKPINR